MFASFFANYSKPKNGFVRHNMKLREICNVRHCENDLQSERVWMSTWNHSGNLLATCGDDKNVVVWTFNDGRLESRTRLDDGHNRAVRCVNFSHCGKFLASASFDATIIVYQKEEGEFVEVNKLEGHESEVKCCAFSPSDEFLATCSRDKSVWFWQMDEDEDFNVSSILQPHTQDVKSVVWHPNEELLVSCSYDSSIRFYRYDGEDWVTQQKIENVHEGTVWSAAFDAEGNRLVTVGEDHFIQLFIRENIGTQPAINDTWKKVARLEIENTRWPLYSVSWNVFNDVIATGGGDSKIRLFKISGNSPETSIIENFGVVGSHELEVNSVSWCPNPQTPSFLTSASDDGNVKVWKLEEC